MQENRSKLITFAASAHTLICEAPFMVKDQQQAKDTQHLTTKACAEIATMEKVAKVAKVAQLLPFHFSSRYEQSYKAVYDELLTLFPKLIL
jgi:ribonuclease Z